jgi:hypothetical protein
VQGDIVTGSEKTHPGFVRVKEQIPYSGKGIDELLGFLRKVLTDNKFTQKMIVEVGVPYLRLEKLVSAVDGAATKLSFHDAARTKPMEEYHAESKTSPLHQLFEMFSIVHAEGLEVGMVLVGDKHVFQDWLKVRIPVTRMSIFGVPLHQLSEIPPDVFLVCGTSEREAESDDIQFSVKGTTL